MIMTVKTLWGMTADDWFLILWGTVEFVLLTFLANYIFLRTL